MSQRISAQIGFLLSAFVTIPLCCVLETGGLGIGKHFVPFTVIDVITVSQEGRRAAKQSERGEMLRWVMFTRECDFSLWVVQCTCISATNGRILAISGFFAIFKFKGFLGSRQEMDHVSV